MYILNQNNIDFMAPLRGHTLKSIATADIPTIHKLKFIKLGGPKFYEILDKSNGSFDNKERHRYYGIRVGDIVECDMSGLPLLRAEVITYGSMDNNKVLVRDLDSGEELWHVAEWLRIVEKVEDRNIKK